MNHEEAKELGYAVTSDGEGVKLSLEGQPVQSWTAKIIEKYKIFGGSPVTLEHPVILEAVAASDRNLSAFYRSSNYSQRAEDKNLDYERLRFLENKACELDDCTTSESILVDDICENGQRELKRHERSMTDSMMQRFKERKSK
jgi:hypothetical protein